MEGTPHIPVQRNKGIDAFLKETYLGIPIPVRVQRKGETIHEAADALRKASKVKHIKCMILIVIDDNSEFPQSSDDLIILSSISFSISKLINSIKNQEKSIN